MPANTFRLGPTGFLLLIVLLYPLLSCKRSGSEPLFREVPSGKSRVAFANNLEEGEDFNLIEYLYYYNGGGVALGDINNDGLADLYFSANQGENKLYLNKGNWRFEDITEKAGVTSPGLWKTGVSMADINGDGLLDIYQCRLGSYKGVSGHNQLFINNGDLTFTERAAEFGLNFSGFSTQAAFADFDLDGDLDMYLLNHSVHTERTYGKAALRRIEDPKSGDRLYWNNGGKFVAITREAGIYSSPIGYGLGVGVSDLNADGWPDLYISNDFNENDYLYLNTGAGIGQPPVFREVSNEAIGHSSRFSMGNDLADYNNDGKVDIISLDMLPEDEVVLKRSAGDDSYEIYKLKLDFGYGRQFTRNALQLNLGIGADSVPVFAEIGQLAGVHATDWSWAPLFADFDNDGLKDLFISNGIRRRPNDMDYINFLSNKELKGGLKNNPNLSDQRLVEEMPDGAVPNYFFRNKGDLTFQNTSAVWMGKRTPTLSNGAAYADLDNDGDLDLVVNHINREASLLRNYAREQKAGTPAYISIQLQGAGKNTSGIGSKIYAYAGKMRWILENYPCRGFQSSVSPILHLGLGSVAQLDSLRVVWPGGKSELRRKVPVNQKLRLKEFEARDIFHESPDQANALLEKTAGILPEYWKHTENRYNDFNTTFLQPHQISREGPAIAVSDVNGDGLDDVFFGNARGGASVLMLQSGRGFVRSGQTALDTVSGYEITNALFFDANGDRFPDLYLVTGGNEVLRRDQQQWLKDRLLLNDGKGHFSDRSDLLPDDFGHGSVAVAADFDRDGDQDILVGGRTVPGKYGIAPKTRLLQNDGKGRFTDVAAQLAPGLQHIGMVSDARWADLDQDSWPDLVLAGEWMPIAIFKNQEGTLVQKTDSGQRSGWWKSLEISDFDGDGDLDVIAGNQGLNTRHAPSSAFPLHSFIADFDANGTLDPVLAYSNPGGIFPIAARDDLSKQMPSMKKRFLKHRDFAGKTIAQVFGAQALGNARHLQAQTFASSLLENRGGLQFIQRPLPLQAQFGPLMEILAADLNGDGLTDLLAGGNDFGASPYFGTYDAGKGIALLGDGKGNFRPLGLLESGLNIPGEIRSIRAVRTKDGQYFLFGMNNGQPLLYKLLKS
ncbi:MAG: VCBS repeat-containing protein [Saprospiraceae bacterium]